MAVRTWTAPLGVAIGAGVLAGAGQLGIGDGLGILRWNQHSLGAAAWHTQLTWIAFVATSAVIVAALAGDWRATRLRQRPDLGQRVVTVVAGAIGAAIVVPLVARPASGIDLADTGSPRLIVAITAGAGLLIGAIGALAMLTFPAVRGNVISCTAWVWAAALVSAVWALGNGSTWASARLAQLPPGGFWTPAVLVGAPVIVALIVSTVARFGGGDPITISASGGTGPLLVGGAYLIAGPGGQSSAYWSALIAVAAGLAISVPVAFVRRPAPARGESTEAGEAGDAPAGVTPANDPGTGENPPGAGSAATTPVPVPEVSPAPDLWSTPGDGGDTSGAAAAQQSAVYRQVADGQPPAVTQYAAPPEQAPRSRRSTARGRTPSTAPAAAPTSGSSPAAPSSSPASPAATAPTTSPTATTDPAVEDGAAEADPGSAREPSSGGTEGKRGWRIPRARKASPAETTAPAGPDVLAGNPAGSTPDKGTPDKGTAADGTAADGTTESDTGTRTERRRGRLWGLKRSGRRTDEQSPTSGLPVRDESETAGFPPVSADGANTPAVGNAPATGPAAPTRRSAKNAGSTPAAGVARTAGATGTAGSTTPAGTAKSSVPAARSAPPAPPATAPSTAASSTAASPTAVPKAARTAAGGQRPAQAPQNTPAGASTAATRDTGARDTGARDTGARDTGASTAGGNTTGDATTGVPAGGAATEKPAKKRGRAGKSVPVDEPTSEQPAGSAATRDRAATQPAGTGPGDDAPTEPTKQRRWASRRKTETQPPATAPEDDEYVDWVKGLGAAEPTVRIGGNRAARHSRDAGGQSPDSSS